MSLVAILALGPEISDAIENLDELDATSPPKISTRRKTCGIRPYGARNDFQKLGLAGAIGADQRHHFAPARGPRIFEARHVDGQKIRGDAADQRTQLSADDGLQTVVGFARRSGIAVGVADGDHCEAHWSFGGRGPVGGDGFACGQIADLQNAPAKLDQRNHGIELPGRGIEAEQCAAKIGRAHV